MDIRYGISEKEVKTIFHGNSNIIRNVARKLSELRNDNTFKEKTSKSYLIKYWDYSLCCPIIREEFKKTEKYNKYIKSKSIFETYTSYFRNILNNDRFKNLPEYSAMVLEQNITKIFGNSSLTPERMVKEFYSAIDSFILYCINSKALAMWRNDYIEYQIFENNENVIPTFGNTRGCDFFINGEPYDQKTSRSVGKTFKEKYPSRWKEDSINHPEEVAKSLYENQSKDRFSSSNRLYIIDINESNNIDISSITNLDFDNPYLISFSYEKEIYEAKSFILYV